MWDSMSAGIAREAVLMLATVFVRANDCFWSKLHLPHVAIYVALVEGILLLGGSLNVQSLEGTESCFGLCTHLKADSHLFD